MAIGCREQYSMERMYGTVPRDDESDTCRRRQRRRVWSLETHYSRPGRSQVCTTVVRMSYVTCRRSNHEAHYCQLTRNAPTLSHLYMHAWDSRHRRKRTHNPLWRKPPDHGNDLGHDSHIQINCLWCRINYNLSYTPWVKKGGDSHRTLVHIFTKYRPILQMLSLAVWQR